MSSIFGTTPTRNNTEQENNLAARKPQISSRKPLGDIRKGDNVAPKPFLKENPAKITGKTVPTEKPANKFVETPQLSFVLPGKFETTPPPENIFFEPEFIENGAESNYKIFLDNFSENCDVFDSSDFPDIDLCSYKEVSENYNDLMGPAEKCQISSILSGQLEKTPPPKKRIFEPELIKNGLEINYKLISGQNAYSFKENFEIFEPEEDVPLPELNF